MQEPTAVRSTTTETSHPKTTSIGSPAAWKLHSTDTSPHQTIKKRKNNPYTYEVVSDSSNQVQKESARKNISSETPFIAGGKRFAESVRDDFSTFSVPYKSTPKTLSTSGRSCVEARPKNRVSSNTSKFLGLFPDDSNNDDYESNEDVDDELADVFSQYSDLGIYTGQKVKSNIITVIL